MKLFYISYARLPTERAYEIQIMNMCSAFKSRGINLELIIPSKQNNQEINLFEYYRIKNKFRIKKLESLDLFKLELTLPSFLWQPIYYIMVFEFYLHSFFYLLFYKPRKEKHRKEEFICYYTRDYLNLLFLWFIKRIKKKGRLFLELHKIPSCVFLFYKFLRLADGIIVLNNILKESLLEKEKNLKILIAQDAVDTSLFKEKDKTCARKKLNIPLDKNIISYAGSLYPYKGIYTLVDSLEYLPKDCILYIIGGPTYYINLLKEYIKQKKPKLAENIKLIGYILQEEVVDYLCSSDVLVLPNTTKDVISFLYTSPLKLFEYASVKRPIVATDTPSLREILTEDDAILVKPDDAFSLAEGIKKILKDKNKAEKLSNHLYNKLKNYTWESRAENIINFMRKYLNKVNNS